MRMRSLFMAELRSEAAECWVDWEESQGHERTDGGSGRWKWNGFWGKLMKEEEEEIAQMMKIFLFNICS